MATTKSGVKAKASKGKGFTEFEKGAMRERVHELQADGGVGEGALLAKIAEMEPADRAIAEKIHAIVKASAPGLAPTTWYGMPAYAMNGKAVCFFKPAKKFKARYATFGFNDSAKLDDGSMWPVEYAVARVTPTEEAKIRALIKKAAG